MDIVLTRILECMGNRYGAGKDLANHLGISGNVITNWKNGSNRSYLKHLREIAEFYNVSESYLLGKTERREGGDLGGSSIIFGIPSTST